MADMYTGLNLPNDGARNSFPESMEMGNDIADSALSDFSNAQYGNDYSDLSVDPGAEGEFINEIINATGANAGLAKYMNLHPDADPEDVLRYMSSRSDEYAEKYLDYLLEQKSLNANNEYSANREDTAYQRLVADLRKAGLNPAMMYGSTASPSSTNSLGYLKMNEGATSRSVGNFTKLKQLLLSILSYELYRKLDTTNQIFKSGKDFTGMLKDIASVSTLFM